MRKLTGAVFVSLDGVMQAPGGPEEDVTGDFRNGGWVQPLWAEDMGPFEKIIMAITTCLGSGPTTLLVVLPHNRTIRRANSVIKNIS